VELRGGVVGLQVLSYRESHLPTATRDEDSLVLERHFGRLLSLMCEAAILRKSDLGTFEVGVRSEEALVKPVAPSRDLRRCCRIRT